MIDTDKPESRLIQGLIVAFVCVGITLRWIDLDLRGLWWDELYSVVSASSSVHLADLWEHWLQDDSHPPGLLPFYWVWFQVFPATELWARVPSAIAGSVMLLYAAYGTRGVLTQTGRGLLTALLACTYMPVYYAQEARPYSILMLCSIVMSTQSWRLFNTEGNTRSWTQLTLVCVLASYAHYFGLFLAGSWLLVLIIHRIRHRWWLDMKRILFCLTAFILTYLPGLYTLKHLIQTDNGAWQKRVPFRDFLTQSFDGYFFNDGKTAATFLGTLVFASVVARWRWNSPSKGTVWPLIAMLGVATTIAAMVNTQTSVLQTRYFLVFLPPIFLLITAMTERQIRNAPVVIRAACIGLPALGLMQWYADYPSYKKQEWREATAWVQDQFDAVNDMAMVLGPDGSQSAGELLQANRINDMFWVRNHAFFQYYVDRSGTESQRIDLQRLPNRLPRSTHWSDGIVRSKNRIFLLAGHHLRLNKKLKRYLSKRYQGFRVKKFKSTRVYVFTHTPRAVPKTGDGEIEHPNGKSDGT